MITWLIAAVVQGVGGPVASPVPVGIFDVLDVTLLVGGLLGGFLRALVSTSQHWYSKYTIVDVVLGGVVGVCYPLIPFIPIPESATIMQRGALVCALAYGGSHFLKAFVDRIYKQAGVAPVDGVVPDEVKK